MRPRRAPGRTMPFRNAAALRIPRDLALPTCDSCGEIYLDAEASRRLDSALEAEYRRLLERAVGDAIERLTRTVSKRQIERSLGLSQGYLSKLPGKATSAVLAALLVLLADDPERRLTRLRKIWTP